MLTALRMVKESSFVVKFGLQGILSSSGSSVFKVLPAHSFLWGYDDKLVDMSKSISQDPLPFEKFGIITNRNGTSRDTFTVHTGEGDLSKIALVTGFNGQRKTNYWATDECNSVDGSDGSQFPPHMVDKRQVLELYIKELCRKFPLEYDRDVILFDEIPAWRYKAPDNVFAHPSVNPYNQCFCHLDTATCAKHGLFNVSSCSMGAPVYASFPHFLHGDPELRKKFIGLNPDQKIHETFMDIHPRLAFPLNGASRFQINVEVNKPSLVSSGLDSFEEGDILPVIWLEIVPGELSQKFKELIYHSSYSANAVQLVLRYGTLIITILTLSLLIVSIHNRKKLQEKKNNRKSSIATVITDCQLQPLNESKPSPQFSPSSEIDGDDNMEDVALDLELKLDTDIKNDNITALYPKI